MNSDASCCTRKAQDKTLDRCGPTQVYNIYLILTHSFIGCGYNRTFLKKKGNLNLLMHLLFTIQPPEWFTSIDIDSRESRKAFQIDVYGKWLASSFKGKLKLIKARKPYDCKDRHGKLKSTLSMIEFRTTKVKCYNKIYHFNS